MDGLVKLLAILLIIIGGFLAFFYSSGDRDTQALMETVQDAWDIRGLINEWKQY